MYDTVQDVKAPPTTQQESNPLPGYDLIGSENGPAKSKITKTSSKENIAAAAISGASEPAEYSVVMKPKKKNNNEGSYNVLVHDTTNGATLSGEDAKDMYSTVSDTLTASVVSVTGNSHVPPPPPLPPPISDSDLKAINSSGTAKIRAASIGDIGRSKEEPSAVELTNGGTAGEDRAEMNESLYMNV